MRNAMSATEKSWKDEPASEYMRNRYGSMAHYTFGWGGGHRYSGTSNPDGSEPKSLDEVADKFAADGKKFISAELLDGGHRITFRQDKKRIILKLPDTARWNPLDTVIKLTAEIGIDF